VRRLPGEPFLSEKQIGEHPQAVAHAAVAGGGAGGNLANVGMNVNLAPVLDVFRQPGDFDDQFGRSYSMDPAKVARLGSTMISVHQRTGVAATAKHFPGLGAAAASQNTDLGPVTLNLPLATIRSVDELPYPAAIRAGVELVMSSWAVYPALDPVLPAGLSPTIVQGELRDRLGFRGVTITDALEAGALQAFGPPPGRAVLAARAGADLLMFAGRDVSVAAAGVDALVTALEDGGLDLAAFQHGAGRVLDLRARIAAGRLRPPG
jgi:beta-N-acetylhexosaminidase